MLVELSVVEQRYLAVREALDTGATITDIASRYGVDRRTVPPLARSLRDRRARSAGRSQLQAGSLPSPDPPEDRGPGRGAQQPTRGGVPAPSSADSAASSRSPPPARPSTGAGASSPHRPQALLASLTSEDLQLMAQDEDLDVL